MTRRILKWGIEIGIFTISGVLAFLLRFDFKLDLPKSAALLHALPVWIVLKSVAFYLLHLDRSWWRFATIHDLVRIGLGNLAGSAAGLAVILLVGPRGFPRSVYVLDLIVCVLLTASVRIAAAWYDALFRGARAARCKKVLIHGAGKAGVMLLHELAANPKLGLQVCGFTDDDPKKAGIFFEDVQVLGTARDIPKLVSRWGIEQILIAIPSASSLQMTEILAHCHRTHASCRTIPGLGEVVQGPALIGRMREVAVEDLLGRQPVQLDTSVIRNRLEDRVVMVTGAGGSIGSELCRQLAAFHPRIIVGYEISETALFFLEQEMRERFPAVPFRPVIGSVQNLRRLVEAFEQHSPSILYHAAAYKHVPMMESHLFEAVENNIFGTWNVATTAILHGLEDFVMISSDKAVRPTSIMGLTKRVSELLLHSLQNGSTKFVSVRFGNVLGSNGSVVPIFKKQIAAGGPVKITHPDMRRYFMTIPEAVQLVLQASTMGNGGEIFELDMGQSVRILDLAVNLIRLSGLRPHEDIKIEFTGVRPGEKLFEELCSVGENARPTFHEKIRVYETNGVSMEPFEPHLERLRHACAARESGALLLELKDMVPEYNPSNQILRQLLAAAPVTRRGPLLARGSHAEIVSPAKDAAPLRVAVGIGRGEGSGRLPPTTSPPS